MRPTRLETLMGMEDIQLDWLNFLDTPMCHDVRRSVRRAKQNLAVSPLVPYAAH